MNTTAKKFSLAALAAPVLAALAIGMAGTAAATPAGPQPSDTRTTTLDPQFKNPKAVPAKLRNKRVQGATQEKPKLGSRVANNAVDYFTDRIPQETYLGYHFQ